MTGGPDERSDIRNLAARPVGACRDVHAGYVLRKYVPDDEEAAIALWLRTWQAAYPQIDFAARLPWWRERWGGELVPNAEIAIAEPQDASAGAMAGFVTVDLATRYLDQIVVAPEFWGAGVGAALIAEAKRLSPSGLDLDVNVDNARAIRFYEKHGFCFGGAGVNPISGKPVHRMIWRP
jgi:putative acetyltransferase